MKRWCPILIGLLLLASGVAHAESDGAWGVRVGVADDPDQVVAGAHWVLERFGGVRQLRFMPNVELGAGDDHTILALTAPVHYMFRDVDANFVPYAGGGVTFAYVDEDKDNGNDDEDFEIALRFTGGLEWELQERRNFFVELNLIAGDVHDIQALVGWTFRSRR